MNLFEDILKEEGIINSQKDTIEFFDIDTIKIPKNMTIMLYGDGGLGKSYFLGDICAKIANKENVCIVYHNIDTNCSPSFMKAFELESNSEHKIELKSDFRIDDKLSVGAVSLLSKLAFKINAKQIIYVIDTLDSAKNLYAQNINFDNTNTSNDGILIEKFYSDLNVFRKELNKLDINISIILVHHSNKSKEVAGSVKIQTGLPLIYSISKDDKNEENRIIELVKNNGIVEEKIILNFNKNYKIIKKENKSNSIVLHNHQRFDPIIKKDDNFELLPLNINLSQINSSIIDTSMIFNNLKIKTNSFDEIPTTMISKELMLMFLPLDFAKIYKTNKNNPYYKGEIIKAIDGDFYIFEQLKEEYETLSMIHKKVLLAIFHNLIVSKSNILKTYTSNIQYSEIAKYLNITHYSASYYKTIQELIYELSTKTYNLIILNEKKEIIKTLTNFEFFKISENNTLKQKATTLYFSPEFIDLFLKDAIIDINKYGKIMTNIFSENIIFSIISFLFSKKKLQITYSELLNILYIPKNDKNAMKVKQKLKKEIINNQDKPNDIQPINLNYKYLEEDSLFKDIEEMEDMLELNAKKIFKIEEKEIKNVIKQLKNKTLLEKLKYFGITLEYKEINKKQYEIIFDYNRPDGVNFYSYKKDSIRRFKKDGTIY